jgi:hypothetical protein
VEPVVTVFEDCAAVVDAELAGEAACVELALVEALLAVAAAVAGALAAALVLEAWAAAGTPLPSDPLAPQAVKTTQHASTDALRPKERDIDRPENH